MAKVLGVKEVVRYSSVRLNTELTKKPKDLMEDVVVHEMLHLVEPTHSERFVALLEQHYPTSRDARAELNELPLAAEIWACPPACPLVTRD